MIGPISRTVADCAITLQAIAGHDPKDRYTSQDSVPDYTAALEGDIRGLKVGVVVERVHTEDVLPEVREAVLEAIEVLRERGAEVSEISLPMIPQTAAFSLVGELVEAAAIHHRWVRERLDEYQHELRLTLLMANLIPAQTYYKANQLRSYWRDQMLAAFDSVDLMVYPTSPSVAPTVPPPSGSGQPGGHEGKLLWATQFHPPGQPCRMSGAIGELRVHGGGSADGPADYWSALR